MQDYIIVTDDMLDDSYLEHYGVVGMHWHHRKAVAAAAKGNYKKMQKHLDKNIANNKKKNGFYYKRLEKVTQKEVDKYKEKKKNNTGAKVALGLATAASVGYLAKKGIERRGEKKNARDMADRYNINNAFNEVRRENQSARANRENIRRTNFNQARQSNVNVRARSSNEVVAEALRQYQEAANRAASSLDNTRNKRKRR